MKPLERVIVALDGLDKNQVFKFVEKSENQFDCYKIGLELFLRYGRSFVLEFFEFSKKEIFLDLKLHDIPKTVSRAIHSLEGLPLKFLSVHLTGGEAMLREAIKSRNIDLPQTLLLGVSYLTSMDENDFKDLWHKDSNRLFKQVFQLAEKTGIDGIVCSPNDLVNAPKKSLKVTPGIRFQEEIQGNRTQDQKRLTDPLNALKNGSDYLVIGRSLTQANDLKEKLQILKNDSLDF